MIHYLTTEGGRESVVVRLAAPGGPLAGIVRPVTYARVLASARVPPGLWIFADLARLPAPEAARAVRLWQAVTAAGARAAALNHPTRALRRYGLLRLLAERGVNAFDVYRPTEARLPRRFPVFLRDDAGDGRAPALLASPAALAAALRARDAAGRSRETCTITEFCNVADAGGRFRTHDAFVVAGAIVPWRTRTGDDWWVGPDAAAEPAVLTAEHAALLREVAALARVDWGAIRWGIRAGRVQVWGIDTDPVLAPSARAPGRGASPAGATAVRSARSAASPAPSLPGGDARDGGGWEAAPAAALRALDRAAGASGDATAIPTGFRPLGPMRTRYHRLAATLHRRAKEIRDRLPPAGGLSRRRGR